MDLEGFSKGITEVAKRREEERQEFNAKLTQPAYFVRDYDHEGPELFGTGFWKAAGGVVAYRRFANGYDPFSRVEYPNELIAILNKVNQGE